ncbi:sigma-E processing peptidase SpoIIGA [Carboxydothermus ferrireducens]|uniref:Stage II sporulation protein GA (Sporulation sigma-E factor processing peptidase) n=1 Tax=Carboxydothermus ferrireducens DSM 11255 TaxID=1119529 RepID=A0ABX2RCM3_9THEO|nr:sigma-E processing peptidase SpoIIGA [Carboxydothermus ferrireducens]NYE58770.1 stage II sporulation protein GA (sporulation sigma-E factor processing peptidase) [Carboxydothermus ferrireducens DSM 11255]
MPVYFLESVFLGNFILSYAALTFAAKVLNLKLSFAKNLFFSLVGAVMAEVYLAWPYFGIKILAFCVFFLSTYLLTKSPSNAGKLFLLTLASFFFLNGAYHALIITGYYPEFFLLAALILAFIGEYAYKQYQRIVRLKKYGFSLEIVYSGKKVTVQSFLDTGNRLYDPQLGWPVVVVEYRAVKKILPVGFFQSKTIRRIPFRGVGRGQGFFWGFIPDELKIWQEGEVIRVKRAVVAITFQSLNSEFQALLSEEILKSA